MPRIQRKAFDPEQSRVESIRALPSIRFGSRVLHPLARQVVTVVATRMYERPNVSEVAKTLGISARTLQKAFVDVQLPPPQRLIVLTRWLAIARVVERNGLPTGQAAALMRYASTQAFCRAARREVRLSVQQLRDPSQCDAIVRDMLTAYGVTGGRDDVRTLDTESRTLDTAPYEPWPDYLSL